MRTFVLIIGLAAVFSGCSKPEFSHRAEYADLIPEGQQYVDKVLDTHFGSPTQMVVWDRLPVKQHIATGTVTASAERSLTFDLSMVEGEIKPGTEVVLLDENLEQSPSLWIREWDEETSTAVLDAPLKTLPEDGQRAIIGPGQILVRGRHLYAEHCQHCHGVAGDGNGPTAKYLSPLPRDYRLGIFKFTLTQASDRARRSDLARTIENGIPGTYMPSFKLLSEEEMTAIVEYVRWLAMRGETEYMLVRFLSESYSESAVRERIESSRSREPDQRETMKSIREELIELANDPNELPLELETFFELIVSRWEAAEQPSALIVPKENRLVYDETSIQRGRELYLSADLQCATCHGEGGFGDGPQTYSITKDLATGEDNPTPGLYDAWGHPIVPRNLHTGIYRGGRRPIDLYSRVHAGIKGTPMPAFGAKLSDQQIWDLVNYVYSVPFETDLAGQPNSMPVDPAPVEEVVSDSSSEEEPSTQQSATDTKDDVADQVAAR